MPEIPISGLPFPSVLAGERIGTLMLWPERPTMIAQRERQLYGRAARQTLREAIASNQIAGAAELEKLRKTAARGRSLAKLAEDDAARHRLGRLVGGIIIEALADHHVDSTAKSLQGAKERRAAAMGIGLKRVDKFDCWPRFRAVAHLWAAHCLFCPAPRQSDPFPCAVARLPDLLAAAEYVLAGCAARARQANTPILEKAKAWRPPSGLSLPLGNIKFILPESSTDL